MTSDEHPDRERGLFELIRDALVVLDAEAVVVGANSAAYELTARLEDDLIGSSLWSFVDPADHETVAAQLAGLRRAGRSGEPLRFRVREPAGAVRWVEVHGTHDRDRDLVYAVARDISGREDVLLGRLAEAFAEAPLGMAFVSLRGRFERVNATLARMVGRSEDELIELDLADVMEPEHRSAWSPDALAATDGSLHAEVRLRRRDGRQAVALVSTTMVRNLRGDPQYHIFQALDVTERHEAQQQLTDNEAKLAEAQQIARMGSWELQIEDDRLSWSDELHRIHGVRIGVGPRTFEDSLERIHSDDRSRVARVVRGAIADGRPWSVDYRIVRGDGELRMLHARGEVTLDDAGRPALVHGICQDVTEGRRVEDALRAAEQLFRRAFDDAPIGMALLDLDGRWLRLNRSICQMLGRSEPELRATRLRELSHPDDRELEDEPRRELLSGRRRSYAVERRYLRADGSVISALLHVSLMHGDGERPLYFLCQFVDITERRRAEAERAAGEQRLKAIIDNSPALIVVKDLRHRFLLVNRRWEDLVELTEEGCLGRTSEECLPVGRIPDQRELDEQVAASGEPLEAMTVIRDRAGAEHTFVTVKFPLRDAAGLLVGVGSIATDLTERLREADARAELERRLAQAERLESVGQLAGGVAHDFNNLLSVILTCVGFAQRALPADHAIRDDIDEIGRAADRAAALTRQLLMFSRREVVAPEAIDVAALTADLQRLLERTLNESIALRMTLADGLPPVRADRAQLEQVLVNLAVNARDAMPDGGSLAIDVARADTTAALGGVAITVSDDGSGMSAAVRDRAFDPFFTTKGPGDGTGLGLATVHGVVIETGGSVEIESIPGTGTSVRIVLPGCADVVAPPPAQEEPAASAPVSARVLVVEDQEPVRRQACRILEAHGYAVRGAGSGDEALAAWETVDVLVTDVVMPGMSGHELAGAAKALAPGLRVVYMSGHTEDVLVRDGVRSGDIAFVQKPFTRASLLRAVDHALAGAVAER